MLGTENIVMMITEPYGRQILNNRTNNYIILMINAMKGGIGCYTNS